MPNDTAPTTSQPKKRLAVVMIGATGAVGSEAAKALASMPSVKKLTLLGRRRLGAVSGDRTEQHTVNMGDPESYREFLSGHQVAICTLGVGEPSKASREDFIRIDKTMVLDFATACKEQGVQHFQLLGSVGANASSRSFYLRTKGELEDSLKALGFERLSLFRPSMILTPTNRYGMTQAIALKVWPLLKPILPRKYRGIPVELLGRAFAGNILTEKSGVEILSWEDFLAASNF